MKDAAQFYANRVVKDYKEKDPSHVKWVHSFSTFLVELFQYVKKWHTTGLSWNPKGGDALSANAGKLQFCKCTPSHYYSSRRFCSSSISTSI